MAKVDRRGRARTRSFNVADGYSRFLLVKALALAVPRLPGDYNSEWLSHRAKLPRESVTVFISEAKSMIRGHWRRAMSSHQVKSSVNHNIFMNTTLLFLHPF